MTKPAKIRHKVRIQITAVSLAALLQCAVAALAVGCASANRAGPLPNNVPTTASPKAAFPPGLPPPLPSPPIRSSLAVEQDSTPSPAQATPVLSQGAVRTPGTTMADVSYPAGWNLVAIVSRDDAPFPIGVTPFYALPHVPGATNYVRLPDRVLGTFTGYWVYVPSAATLHVTGSSTIGTRIPVFAGYTAVGNSSAAAAVVDGADIVYVYDPSTGYRPTTTLAPGQGGLVFSATDRRIGIYDP